jgi:hypothetical protein
LVLGLVAAVAGIYFADRPPFTHIAAAAVVVAAAIGIIQALRAEREAAFVRATLAGLARSLPPSPWWKEKVNRLAEEIGKGHGYILQNTVYDRRDFRDPEACSILVFRSPPAKGATRNGLLVLTPRDYSDLSPLGKQELAPAVNQLLLVAPPDSSRKALQRRIGEVAAALYAVPRVGQGFKIATQFDGTSGTLSVTLGHVHLSLDSAAVDRLIKMRPVERDLYVAGEIEKTDPALSHWIQ